MHPTLLIDLARDIHAERFRAADRERLVQASRARRAYRRAVHDRRGLSGPRAADDAGRALLNDTTTALMEAPAR